MGVLGRFREADAEPVAQAIAASFDHLRLWMPWATEGARHLDAQRIFRHESETQRDEGLDYIWLLRPNGDDAVAGSFGRTSLSRPGRHRSGVLHAIDEAYGASGVPNRWCLLTDGGSTGLPGHVLSEVPDLELTRKIMRRVQRSHVDEA